MTISVPLSTIADNLRQAHFDDRPKILTYRQISSNMLLPKNCPMKIKVSQAQSK